MKPSTVSAVMTAEPVTVRTTTPFKDIAELLFAKGISAVGVLDKDGALVGVVSEADLLPHLSELPGLGRRSRWIGARRRRLATKATARVAKDLMTSPAITVDADEPLAAAAALCVRSGLRRLFVLEGGRTVGVVSRRDLVGIFARGDEELAKEAGRRLLGSSLALGPDRVRVAVCAGVVTIVGRVERRSDLEPVTRLVRAMPGVVAVDNRLDFVWDNVDA